MLVAWQSQVYEVELRCQSVGDVVSSSSRWSHGTEKVCLLDFDEQVQVGSVVPASEVNVLSDEFKRSLGSVGVWLWHVEVVDETTPFFPRGGLYFLLAEVFSLL